MVQILIKIEHMKKIVASLLIVSLVTVGCASTPANPVQLAQVGDETKTCDAITNEMQQMINAQQQAASDKNNQVGGNNTGIGYNALASNTNGMFNAAIGYGADVASGSLSNATAIGANA